MPTLEERQAAMEARKKLRLGGASEDEVRAAQKSTGPDIEKLSATDPAVRAAMTKLKKISKAEFAELLNGARVAAEEAVKVEVRKIYDAPVADFNAANGGSLTRTDHYSRNGAIGVTGNLTSMEGNPGDNTLRLALYQLLQIAQTPVDITQLTPYVMENMRFTAIAARAADTQQQADWDEIYAQNRRPDDIGLYDADQLLLKHLQRQGAQAALKEMGIKFQEQVAGASQSV